MTVRLTIIPARQAHVNVVLCLVPEGQTASHSADCGSPLAHAGTDALRLGRRSEPLGRRLRTQEIWVRPRLVVIAKHQRMSLGLLLCGLLCTCNIQHPVEIFRRGPPERLEQLLVIRGLPRPSTVLLYSAAPPGLSYKPAHVSRGPVSQARARNFTSLYVTLRNSTSLYVTLRNSVN